MLGLIPSGGIRERREMNSSKQTKNYFKRRNQKTFHQNTLLPDHLPSVQEIEGRKQVLNYHSYCGILFYFILLYDSEKRDLVGNEQKHEIFTQKTPLLI